jgi:hypothetical protein
MKIELFCVEDMPFLAKAFKAYNPLTERYFMKILKMLFWLIVKIILEF